MPNYQKLLAMTWGGLGAITLIAGGVFTVSKGDTVSGLALIAVGSPMLGTLLGFAVGEANGIKNERKKQTDS